MSVENIIDVVIKLRRDTEENYNIVKNTFVPKRGEPILVDTARDGLKVKIGDGVTAYGALEFNGDIIIRGYYLGGEFYKDTSYTKPIKKSSQNLYVNISDKMIYTCNGIQYEKIVGDATDKIAGVMKLYTSYGNNEDGTLTQKAITEYIEKIKFATDEVEDECLILDKPW